MNSDSTAYNSLYHLQKGPDGTNILKNHLKRTSEGLGCQGRDYNKETSERTKDYLVKGHELNLLKRDLFSDPSEEDIILICCSKYTNLLLWIQQSQTWTYLYIALELKTHSLKNSIVQA